MHIGKNRRFRLKFVFFAKLDEFSQNPHFSCKSFQRRRRSPAARRRRPSPASHADPPPPAISPRARHPRPTCNGTHAPPAMAPTPHLQWHLRPTCNGTYGTPAMAPTAHLQRDSRTVVVGKKRSQPDPGKAGRKTPRRVARHINLLPRKQNCGGSRERRCYLSAIRRTMVCGGGSMLRSAGE